MLIGAGGPHDLASIKLATRRGTFIPNERPLERSPAAMAAALETCRTKHPDINLRSLASTYNCMGMVFATRRTAIDIASLELILREDDYRKLTTINEVITGDMVVYRNPANGPATHVAIVIQVNRGRANEVLSLRVLSQWGFDGEYFHDSRDVPKLYGEPTDFWTDRKSVL